MQVSSRSRHACLNDMRKRNLKLTVLKIVFCLALACLLAAMIFFPLLSRSNGTLTSLTVTLTNDAYGIGIHPDREFDLPTGSLYWDMPVRLVDAALLLLTVCSFVAWLL